MVLMMCMCALLQVLYCLKPCSIHNKSDIFSHLFSFLGKFNISKIYAKILYGNYPIELARPRPPWNAFHFLSMHENFYFFTHCSVFSLSFSRIQVCCYHNFTTLALSKLNVAASYHCHFSLFLLLLAEFKEREWKKKFFRSLLWKFSACLRHFSRASRRVQSGFFILNEKRKKLFFW